FAAGALLTACLWTAVGSAARERPTPSPEAPVQGSVPLEPWTPGTLDIHHLDTGQGNATFFVLPDGTTLLVDAGDAAGRVPNADPIPDASRTAGARIAAYVRKASPRPELDYVLLTHFHSDHMGYLSEESPKGEGGYALSGVTEVAESLPIHTLLDRGWPEYSYPAVQDSEGMRQYRRFLEWQRGHRGLEVERFQAGRGDQIVLRKDAAAYPSFEIRNLAVNGEVWTGDGEEFEARIPPIGSIPKADLPTENQMSAAFRLRYGPFDYYAGGDLPGAPDDGTPSWHDLETPLARVVGPVEVHVVNHHGSLDPANPAFLSALKPRIHILPAWAASHPAPVVLKRLLNERIYPGPREVFATRIRSEIKAVLGRRGDAFASDHGHILVRVDPGGTTYRILILDPTDGPLTVREVHGPYPSE
ncbi:MAG: MBL fold metallo-hydrolase, partial [Acidobacteria bacterium]|nr:MBL fold metallo-hydrolase [Acidobacteriota bacterium]